MNMLEAVCPNGHRLQVPLEHAGMKLRCPAPGCGVIFQLSASSPTGSTHAVAPAAAGPGTPAPAPNAGASPAPAPAPAPAPQPQSSQTYGTAPLPPSQVGGDGGRWAGTEAAPNPGLGSGPQPVPQLSIPPRNFGSRSLDLSGGLLLGIAQAVLMLGLVLVLTSRGCDSLGMRNIAKLKARADHEERSFESKHKAIIEGIEAELANDKLNDKAKADLTKKRDEAVEARRKELPLNKVKRTELENAANDAVSSNLTWGYWREMLFVAGTILLALGLSSVAFVGQGVERYLCFGLLGIIVFSIYVGGAAWFTSIVSGLPGFR